MPRNWNFTSVTNPANRIIFRQPHTLFITDMWWGTIVLKPHVDVCIEGHIFL
jgi:hypothetical protein